MAMGPLLSRMELDYCRELSKQHQMLQEEVMIFGGDNGLLQEILHGFRMKGVTLLVEISWYWTARINSWDINNWHNHSVHVCVYIYVYVYVYSCIYICMYM